MHMLRYLILERKIIRNYRRVVVGWVDYYLVTHTNFPDESGYPNNKIHIHIHSICIYNMIVGLPDNKEKGLHHKNEWVECKCYFLLHYSIKYFQDFIYLFDLEWGDISPFHDWIDVLTYL